MATESQRNENRSTGQVERTRLHEQLDDLLNMGAVFLSGSAGIGKTMLVSTYARARELPLFSIRIRDEDIDPFNILVRINLLSASLGASTHPEPQTPDPMAAGKRAFSRLFDTCTDSCVLFFDDFERLPDDSVTMALLAQVLSELPAHWKMIFASRQGTPAVFARAEASARIAMMHEHELRLTELEAREVAVAHALKPLTEDSLQMIVSLADGWAALVVLLARAPRLQNTTLPGDRLPDVVFDYFAQEVLETLPPDSQRDLKTIAVLPELSESVAACLTGDPVTVSRLADLADRHFFLERVHLRRERSDTRDAPARYRMHALFRTFLQQRRNQGLDEDERRRLDLQAATVLEDQGEFEAAIVLYLQYGNLTAATDAIKAVAPRLVFEQRHATLLSWMAQLPQDQVRQCPRLSMWTGAASMLSDPVAARQWLTHSIETMGPDEKANSILACCLAIDTWLLHWDDFHGMDVWIERLEGRLAIGEGDLPPDLQAHVCCAMLNASLFRGTDAAVRDHWYDRGTELLDQAGDPTVYMMLAQALVVSPTWSDNVARADLVLDKIEKTLFNDGHPDPLSELWFRSFEIALRWYGADREGAEAALLRGQRCAEESGARFSDVLLPYHAGIACLIAGDVAAAHTHADRVSAATQSEQMMNVVCHHQLQGMIAWHEHRYTNAFSHLQEAADRAMQAGMVFAAAWLYGGLGVVCIDQGDHGQARSWFKRAKEHVDRLNLSGTRVDILMGEAWMSLRSEDNANRQELLERALSAASRDARVASAWWSRAMLSELCGAALAMGVETRHVHHIVAAHQLPPSPCFRHVENWPWRIRIRLLGKPAIVVDGKELTIESRRHSKPMELIYALAALGGDAPAEKLADMLWPDALGDAAMDSFKTTLNRARRKLRVEDALRLSAGNLSFAADLVWVDVMAVLALSGTGTEPENAAGTRTASTKDDRESMDSQVIALYRGDLLEQSHDVWAGRARQRVRELWLRAVFRRAETLTSQDRHADAVSLYEHALECSPSVEVLYRKGMQACLDAGLPDEGVLLYERCLLQLNHAPDASTKRLHQSLSAARSAS